MENILKKTNNNRGRDNDRDNDRDNPKFEQSTQLQTGLFNQPANNHSILNQNQLILLNIFYLNREIGICPKGLRNKQMHQNTIKNFINKAIDNGWLIKLKSIKGATINNLYAFYKEPDKLKTGQVVSDKRNTYYQITKFGINIFEKNENVSL